MGLKETFISYTELQRSARNMKEAYGSQDTRTIKAYEKANEVKRLVLDIIDDLESR